MTTTLPSTFVEKHARKTMTAEEAIADLDARHWTMSHELIKIINRPTGNTYVVRTTHRTDKYHGTFCPWCN